jgi:hypothetical protein
VQACRVHPADDFRQSQEAAAARLLNCHLDVDAETLRLRQQLLRLPGQRRVVGNPSQNEANRTSWTESCGKHGRGARARLRTGLAASLYYRLRPGIDFAPGGRVT